MSSSRRTAVIALSLAALPAAALVGEKGIGTFRVNVDAGGAQADAESNTGRIAISEDGRFVAFDSLADNLVAGDTNAVLDVFVHDRMTGATERVSVDSAGAEGNDASFFPAISSRMRAGSVRSCTAIPLLASASIIAAAMGVFMLAFHSFAWTALM